MQIAASVFFYVFLRMLPPHSLVLFLILYY